jgi:phosphodiesterase/alkaline phosphatase D-like protein
MPLRRTAVPTGLKLDLYRGLTYGDLADFSVLDTRQENPHLKFYNSQRLVAIP